MNNHRQWSEQLVNSSHIEILVVDTERNNLYVNPRLCEMFGYSQEFLLTNTAEIFHINHTTFLNFAELAFNAVLQDHIKGKTEYYEVASWYAEGLNPGVLAMNLAVKQLQQKDFLEVFEALMKETTCRAKWIELEVTESQIMSKPEEAIKILNKISNAGIELAVDDFGTGYSSLAYLKRLPIDKLKIDQAFVRDLPYDEEDSGITRAVIALAKSLKLKVIAEGVETKEQKDFLVENGCENIQGYYYSKPIPADELEVILKNGLYKKGTNV